MPDTQKAIPCYKEAAAQENQYSGIDVSGSLFITSKTGSSIALKRIQPADRQNDLVAVQGVY